MNAISITFLLINSAALLLLPRRFAPLPLLVGACYMTMGQALEVGPFTLHVIRILMAVGIVRVIMRGERLEGGMNVLDWMMVVWAIWGVLSSFFHNNLSDAIIFRLGIVYNVCGIYFLIRLFCQSLDAILKLCIMIAILLIPLAFEMLYETLTQHNLFSILGRVRETPVIREGRIRAQGPFAHSILAGTVGAVCIPLMIVLWNRHRKAAIAGIVASLVIVVSSASSGPVLSLIFGVGALFMWRFRTKMRLIRWLAIMGYLGLSFFMKDPVYYYLLSRLNVIGGSTGWHRANLIRSSFRHLDEWWLGGTDYTRHWMATGVSFSDKHSDITNYYLHLGVIGGLPLMLMFIAVLVKGFSFIGYMLREVTDISPEVRFMIWAFGASLFAHALTSIAVSYFDQSFMFIYLTLAGIGSAWSATSIARSKQKKVELSACASSKSEYHHC